METSRIYILFILSLLALCACGGGDDGEEPIISNERITPTNAEYLDVTPNVELLAGGQSMAITISANCNWTITKDADWLTVNPLSGSNSLTITITAGKNTTGTERIAILSIKGGSLSPRQVVVTQLKASDTTPDTPDPDTDTTQEPTSGDNLPPS